MPRPASSSSSENRDSGSRTTPLPMTQTAWSFRTPTGRMWKIQVWPPTSTVWPALAPPWKRTTTSAPAAR